VWSVDEAPEYPNVHMYIHTTVLSVHNCSFAIGVMINAKSEVLVYGEARTNEFSRPAYGPIGLIVCNIVLQRFVTNRHLYEYKKFQTACLRDVHAEMPVT
jgi:hypothetical protein